MTLSMSEAAEAIGAERQGEDVTFTGLSTDTRTVERNNMFVALRGPHFDAHDFVTDAESRGAAAVTVSRSVETTLPRLEVSDTRLALGHLASYWRERTGVPMVGVTGSNGKTTVKEMMAAILRVRGPVLATRGNLNNDIGVPLTLTRLSPEHRYAVIEMGANHAGEIAYLAGLAKPDVAVITNVAAAHLAGFGSIEGIAAAKGEIFAALPAGGTAIINAEDRFASYWRERCGHCRVMDFGIDAPATVNGVWNGNATGSELTISYIGNEITVKLPLPGRHNAMNALAAAAATLAMGATLQDVGSGLESMKSVPGRLQTRRGLRGSLIIDDSYNANPGSIAAAIDVLTGSAGETWLVLGDMGELGENANDLHAEAGRKATDKGVSRLFTFGELARNAAVAFGDDRAEHFSDKDELLARLQSLLRADVTVLVKGSRAMHMERVVAGLVAPEPLGVEEKR